MTSEISVINWIPDSLENIDDLTFGSYRATTKNPKITRETNPVKARLILSLNEFV
jgi:hypothetical protein